MICNNCFQDVDNISFSYCPHCGKQISPELLYNKGESQTNDVFTNNKYRIITTDCEQFLTGEMWSLDPNPDPLIENDVIYQQEPYSYNSKFLDLNGKEIFLETSHDKNIFENTLVYTTRNSKLIIDEDLYKVDKSSLDKTFLKISKNNKFGFIDLKGREIIPCNYDTADNFEYGFCVAQLQGRKLVINEKNVTIASFESSQKYINIRIISPDIFYVTNIRDNSHHRPYGRIYSADGRVLREIELMGEVEYLGESYYQLDESGGYQRLELFKYSDGQLNKVTTPGIACYSYSYFKNGLMHLRNGSSHAWMDKYGKIHQVAGRLRYMYSFEPSEEGQIMGQTLFDRERNRWCLWNVLSDSKECEYEGPYTHFFRCHFSEGLIPFKLYDGNTGYMTIDGTIAFMTETPCKYLFDFHNGISYIKTDEGIAFINNKGKRITPFLYDRVSYCEQSGAYLAHLKSNSTIQFNGGFSHLIFSIEKYTHVNGFGANEKISSDYHTSIIPKSFSNYHSRYLESQIDETKYLDSVKHSISFDYDNVYEVRGEYPYLYLESNGNKGLASQKAEILIPCVYDDIKPYFYSSNKKFAYSEVCVNSKWGFHDGQKECVPCIFDFLVRDTDNHVYKAFIGDKVAIVNYSNWKSSTELYDHIIFEDGKCYVTDGGQTGLYDSSNCVEIIECMYESIVKTDVWYLFKVYSSGLAGIYSLRDKKIIISCEFDDITPAYGLYKVFKNGKVGLFSEKEQIIECKYDDIKRVSQYDGDNYIVYKNNKCAFIGEKYIKFPAYVYDDVELIDTDYETYLFKVFNGQFWGIYNEREFHPWGRTYSTDVKLHFIGLDRIEFRYSSIEKLESSKKLLKCRLNNKYGVINEAEEEEILPFIYNEITYMYVIDQQILYKVQSDYQIGIYTLYRQRMSCLIPCNYEDILLNYVPNVHLVKEHGKWGIYNGLDCKYDKIEFPVGLYVIAWINGKCGLCQRGGRIFTEVIYDEIVYLNIKISKIMPFYPFKVRIEDKWGMISPCTFIECKYDDIVYNEETDMISFYFGSECTRISSADFRARHLELKNQVPSQVNITNRLKFEL